MEMLGMREENKQLHQKSRLDALTGIANRASFDERLAAELSRAQQMHRTVALCILDIDHFKKFNDTHGHQVGDQVLQLVARTLDESIRKMDLAARYGGEEFAVIAPDCDVESIVRMAERLRKAIESIAFSHQGHPLRITTSVGVAFAEWPHHPRQARDLIQAADQRLYEAKRSGRNCCRVESLKERAA
jgi:diguanylate cyclase (GGDEF)-like protein